VPDQTPSTSVQDVQKLLEAQQAQIAELTSRMLQLTELLTASPPAAQAAQPQIQASAAATTPYGFEADAYFIRIKPYNKQVGHVRRNQFFSEIGRLVRGGTGQVGDVPEWVGPVSREVAIAVSAYRQRAYDLDSPPVCDVVTAEEKEAIDAGESQYRVAALGLMGISPQQILAQMQRAGGQVNARTGAPPPRRQKPSTVQGAQAYQQLQQAQAQVQAAPAPGLAQVQRIAPPALSGRAAALANLSAPPAPPVAPVAAAPQPAPAAAAAAAPLPALPPVPDLSDLPPPPPSTAQVLSERNVSEDLTREARGDTSAEAAIAAAEKYVPSLGASPSRMRPKGR